MIHLVELSKAYETEVGRRVILHPTSLSIPTDRGVAVLGRNGAGKSTLLRLIAGIEEPDTGMVIRQASLSWPIGYAGGVHGLLTGRQNCAFVARIHGVPSREVIDYVERFCELGEYLDMPVSVYSSGMRSRLLFGISLSLDFDCYLIDEGMSTGDRWFRQKALAEFDRRRGRSGILFISHNAASVKQYCDSALVLRNGRLVPFERLDDAVEFYHFGILP